MLTRCIARSFSTAAPKSVAFIGLGDMGMPMAINLAKNNFKVSGVDLSAANLEEAEANGITPVGSIKEACSNVDFVVTCLPKKHDILGAHLDADGVLASVQPNTVVMDASTVTPMVVREIGEHAEEKGIVFCDSPLGGGGVWAAKRGALVFMVGAKNEEHFEKAKVCLAGMGNKFFHCGPVGNGQAVKISHNLTLAIHMIASAEGMVLGEKLGIDPLVLMQILQVSTAANPCNGIYNPRPGNYPDSAASRNYERGFKTDLMKKDLSLAIEAAEYIGANVDIAKKAHDFYDQVSAAGYGDKDFGYVYQYILKDFKI